MEEGQLQKIQSWFENLDWKVENLVTKQQFENRFQALLTAITNIHNKLEAYTIRQDHSEEELTLLKRALHDLEQEVRDLRQRVIGS